MFANCLLLSRYKTASVKHAPVSRRIIGPAVCKAALISARGGWLLYNYLPMSVSANMHSHIRWSFLMDVLALNLFATIAGACLVELLVATWKTLAETARAVHHGLDSYTEEELSAWRIAHETQDLIRKPASYFKRVLTWRATPQAAGLRSFCQSAGLL